METPIENLTELSDKQAIEQCLAGQSDPFRILIRRYQPIVRAWLAHHHRVNDPDDIVQETFLRAWRGLPGLRDTTRLGPWLLGIAHLVMLETIRAEKKQKEVAQMKPITDNPGRPHTSGDYDLEEAIDKLPEAYRNLVMLRYFSGLTCQEVALQMEMPLGSVTKMLSRAYQMLREILKLAKK